MTTALSTDDQKRAAARAALDWLVPRLRADTIVGVGTGSTADHFIDSLASHRHAFAGAVASSSRSAARLVGAGVRVHDLNDVTALPVYVDGADEVTPDLAMTKGGGGALTREKIVAAAADVFACVADASKRVERLGRFPIPIEVIPMACALVVRALERLAPALGLAAPEIRLRADATGAPYVTDNGHWILDVGGWSIVDPVGVETRIGALVGVVEVGLFARRGADLLFLAGPDGVDRVDRVNSLVA